MRRRRKCAPSPEIGFPSILVRPAAAQRRPLFMRIKKIGGIARRGQKLKGRERKRRGDHMVGGRLVDVVKDEIRFYDAYFWQFYRSTL